MASLLEGAWDIRLGEVLTADTLDLEAEAYTLYEPPPLGSLVVVTAPTIIYGVVYSASTASIEPGRVPVALGRESQREEEIARLQPQLSLLLRTTFRARIVGHRRGVRFYPYLPPQPPQVHRFVYACRPEELRGLVEQLEFLGLLLNPSVTAVEEVVAACLRQAAAVASDPAAFLRRAGQELARLLAQDLPRLTAILRRVGP